MRTQPESALHLGFLGMWMGQRFSAAPPLDQFDVDTNTPGHLRASLREDMTSNIVIDALRMVWFKRQPGKLAGVLFHSDRGRQYASHAFRDALK